jgi:hypothetical protein
MQGDRTLHKTSLTKFVYFESYYNYTPFEKVGLLGGFV